MNTVCGTSFQVTNLLAAEGNRLLGQPFFSVDRIILPVGISFYTFQIISYTADVYRGLVKPVRNCSISVSTSRSSPNWWPDLS